MEWITEFVYHYGLKDFYSNEHLYSEKGFQNSVLCGFGIDVTEWMPKASGVGVTVASMLVLVYAILVRVRFD